MKRTVYGQKLYYRDEHDDFTNFKASLVRPIDGSYRYETKNPFFRFFSFLLYYAIAFPVITLLCRIVCGLRVKGKKNVREVGKSGFVVYSNHIHTLDCAFAFAFSAFPRRAFIVCNPDAVHIPFVRVITKMIGAVPVPEDMAAFRNFTRTVDGKLKSGKCVIVMPEAHIWPYCTFVRPFPTTSFTYAAKNGVPAVPTCVIYRKPRGPFKNYRKPRATLMIGKPVWPDAELSVKKNAEVMRDAVFEFMSAAAEHNEVVLYEYIRREDRPDPRTQIARVKVAQKQRYAAAKHLRKFGKRTYRYAFVPEEEESCEETEQHA